MRAMASYITLLLLTYTATAAVLPARSSSQWSTLSPIPGAPRQEHATVLLDDTMYIIGGGVPAADIFPFFQTTDVVQKYCFSTNEWSMVAPIPIPLNHVNAAAVDGKIYVLGGLKDQRDEEGLSWVAETGSWVYDPLTDEWQSLPPIPEAGRGSAAVGVDGSTIWLAGGMRELVVAIDGLQDSVANVSAFDTVTRQWLDLPEIAKQMPAGRDHAGAGIVGHSFYVLGGRDNGQDQVRDTVFALDLRHVEKGWTTESTRMPTPRAGCPSATIGSEIFTFGGEGNPDPDSQGVFPQTESYNPITGRWTQWQNMTLPIHGTYAISAHGKAYIPGGGTQIGGSPVNDVAVFTPVKRCR